MSGPLRRTPLFDAAKALGGRCVPFGGWEMPVQFSGILDEHRTVRTAAGLFDISHMGQITVRGEQAAPWLNSLLSNDIERLAPYQSQYTFMLNENGGVMDDLIVYRLGEGEFFLVINAAVAEQDLAWMESRLDQDVEILAHREERAGLALQGPLAPAIFEKAFDRAQVRPRHVAELKWEGLLLLVAGTGYTGEPGCELFFSAADAERVWNHVMKVGAPMGLKPCGLGARDTLRLEMAYPLNGSDLSPEHTPIEADLGVFVSLKKRAPFPGRAVCEEQKRNGPTCLLSALLFEPGTPSPRAHQPVLIEGRKVSELTSGAISPCLGRGIALAYLEPALRGNDSRLTVEIRGKEYPVAIVEKPFYRSRNL
ncbi:MAG: glycine cleavage system aminomethyltransferase GcvT [Verrucomicrobiia bacterium]